MLVRVKITNDIWMEEQQDTEAAAFKAISRLSETFGHTCCGKCKSTNVRFVCRKDKDDNDWLEIVCQNYSSCGAKLVFGQAKKGGIIYPKTRWDNLSATQQEQRMGEKAHADSHKGYLPNGGWFIYKAPQPKE